MHFREVEQKKFLVVILVKKAEQIKHLFLRKWFG